MDLHCFFTRLSELFSENQVINKQASQTTKNRKLPNFYKLTNQDFVPFLIT